MESLLGSRSIYVAMTQDNPRSTVGGAEAQIEYIWMTSQERFQDGCSSCSSSMCLKSVWDWKLTLNPWQVSCLIDP